MNKKKLLIVSDSFMPRIDGVAKFLEGIIPYIKDKFQLTIIAPDYHKNNTSKNSQDKNKLSEINLILMPIYPFYLGDYQLPRKDSKKIVKEIISNDIIWTNTLGPLGSYAIKKGEKEGKKIISYIHSIEWELFSKGFSKSIFIYKTIEPLARIYARKLYNKCNRLMIPSAETKKKLEDNKIFVPTSIVHMGIDTKKFYPVEDKNKAKSSIGIDPSNFVVGYIGRIAKEKDLGTLIKAFDSLNIKKKTLMIVGKGSKSIEKTIESKNILKTGAVSDVVPYLHAMDTFVLPSLTETSSLSTMEAMSCELPVICTPVGNIKYYIKNKENGLLFDPRNDETLSEHLYEIYKDKNLRKKLGKSARQTIKSDYTWKNTVENILKELERL